jgi:hypothetical protein
MQTVKKDPESSPERTITPEAADSETQQQNLEDVGRRAQELIEELHDRDPQKTTVIRGQDRIGGT